MSNRRVWTKNLMIIRKIAWLSQTRMDFCPKMTLHDIIKISQIRVKAYLFQICHQNVVNIHRNDPKWSEWDLILPILSNSRLKPRIEKLLICLPCINCDYFYDDLIYWIPILISSCEKVFSKGDCMYSLLYLIYAFRNSRALGVKNSQIRKGWSPSDELRFWRFWSIRV